MNRKNYETGIAWIVLGCALAAAYWLNVHQDVLTKVWNFIIHL